MCCALLRGSLSSVIVFCRKKKRIGFAKLVCRLKLKRVVRLWCFLQRCSFFYLSAVLWTPRMEHDVNSRGLGPGDSRSPSDVGSVAQSQVRRALTEGSPVWFKQPARWRNSSWQIRSFEIVLNSLNPGDSGARVELQAVLRRAKEVTQEPVQRSSTREPSIRPRNNC